MKFELNQKHFLITGSAGGIGSAIVTLLIKEGCYVTLHYNNTTPNLNQLSKEELNRITTLKANLVNEVEVKDLFLDANAKFGRIDGLVCNAGIWPPKDVLIKDMSLERWETTLKVNLTGYFLSMKYFFKNLEKFPGEEASAVLIGSTAGIFGEAFHSDYSTSKAGLHGLMLSAKNEIVRIARKGRVNIVSPGWTVTPMAEKYLEDDNLVTKVLQTVPLRKVAFARDIATQVMVLLSSALSGHVTGQNIVVAGGMVGRILFDKDEFDLEKNFG
jgi:NAD(P)-dependent dehydrogenase (short-subunit alcohol dehydrogenase family)